jgi:RNA polymerase sigma-70 factor (ECF subfamily)
VGGYVVARTGDPELGETITAQVFALVVRKFDQCRGSPAAWLWAIVRSELARHFRDRKRHQRIDAAFDGALIDPRPTPAQAMHETERHGQLHEALEQLDEDEHTIVYMKFFQDLPNFEIAQALNVTANLIGVKIHRTLKKLRDLMETPESTAGQGQAPMNPQHL